MPQLSIDDVERIARAMPGLGELEAKLHVRDTPSLTVVDWLGLTVTIVKELDGKEHVVQLRLGPNDLVGDYAVDAVQRWLRVALQNLAHYVPLGPFRIVGDPWPAGSVRS